MNDRFWRHTEAVGACRIWRGAKKSADGVFYGVVMRYGQNQPAHRVAWESVYGPLLLGVHLRNSCGNTLCVRPDHWRRWDNPDRDQAIVERRRAGRSHDQIAVEFGLSPSRVSKILRREGAVGRGK